MKALRFFLICFFTGAGFSFVQAQDDEPQIDYEVLGAFSFDNSFLKDYFLGFSGGIAERKTQTSARIGFDFRPYFKRISYKISDTEIHQYAQKDYFVHLAIDKRFALKKQYPKMLLFAEVKTGYLWGNFRGLDKGPGGKFAVSPIAGIAIATDEVFHVRMGYQYMPTLTETIPSHRIFLSILLL